jgi:hypothetical protein
MALSKTIMTNIGVEAAYHVISALHVYPEKQAVHIDVDSYVSAQMKENGYTPLATYQFEFTGEGYPFAGASFSIGDAYSAVKTREMFADAQEV